MRRAIFRVEIDVDASPIAGHIPMTRWLRCLPHLMATGVGSAASVPLAMVTSGIVAATGEVPDSIQRWQVTILRERVRCYGYFFLLRHDTPPVAWRPSLRDPGDDPRVRVWATRRSPLHRTIPRRQAAIRSIRVASHLVLLLPIAVVMDGLYPAWMAVAARRGGWSAATRAGLLAVESWVTEVIAYGTFVSDEVPAPARRQLRQLRSAVSSASSTLGSEPGSASTNDRVGGSQVASRFAANAAGPSRLSG